MFCLRVGFDRGKCLLGAANFVVVQIDSSSKTAAGLISSSTQAPRNGLGGDNKLEGQYPIQVALFCAASDCIAPVVHSRSYGLVL